MDFPRFAEAFPQVMAGVMSNLNVRFATVASVCTSANQPANIPVSVAPLINVFHPWYFASAPPPIAGPLTPELCR